MTATLTRSAAQVLRSLATSYRLLLGVAALVAAFAALLGYAIDVLGGPLTQSIWEHAGTPARWTLFVIGSMITATALPAYVAHGLTRRAFTLAAATAAVLFAALVALYLAAGLLLEQAIFAAADRPYELAGAHLFASPSQVHLVFTEYLLAGLGYLAGGWLAGAGIYRFGWLRGLPAIPLGLLCPALVENLLGVGQWLGLGPPTLGWLTPDLPLAAALALAVVVLVATLAAVWTLTRSVPITHGRPA